MIPTKIKNKNGKLIEYKQPSIVVKIGNSSASGIVIGSHFDTFPKYDPAIWLVTNYVDNDLTAYVATLIQKYIKQPVNYTESTAPASDNFSWFNKGIPVTFPFEAEMKLGKGNLNVHTSHDTMDKLSIAHMLDYVKLAVSFSVELAKPV